MPPAEIALRDLIDRPTWMADAACAEHPVATFYPVASTPETQAHRGIGRAARRAELAAVAICRTCPVRTECAAYALETGEVWGVWGGLTEIQRHRLRTRGDLTA